MRNVKILSLDGGGMRGIFSATFLERFCQQAGIPGNQLWEFFDIIAGTSIGGIQALAYSNGVSPSSMINLLSTQGPDIFSIRSPVCLVNCEGPAGSVTQGLVLLTPVYDPYIYDSAPLRSALSNVLGSTKMFQLKTNTLITSVSFTGGTDSDDLVFPYGDLNSANYNHFSNVLIPGFTTGQNYTCVDVGVATGSAPVFFAPAQISGSPANNWYIDGGLYQNNPTALACAFANVLFPQATTTCVLSVGTGFSLPDFTPLSSSPDVGAAPQTSLSLLGNSLALTIDGASKAVDQQLELMSLYNGFSSNLFYYRFQSFMGNQSLNQLDNPTSEAITYFQQTANEQYDQDSLKIQLFIEKLQLGN